MLVGSVGECETLFPVVVVPARFPFPLAPSRVSHTFPASSMYTPMRFAV